MKSQIIRKQAGLNASKTNTVLQYFEVQPDDKNLERYICDVDYVVERIKGKKESFYVNRGGREIDVFVNHKPNDGEEFIQTEKDDTSKDNLWSLPDFEFSKDEYVRKGTPEPKYKPYTFKGLLPYLLSAMILGLLLPILYCWLSGGCFCGKPKILVDTVIVPRHCSTCDVKVLNAIVHFKYDKTDYDNLKGEDSAATLEKCLKQLVSDSTNFYVELKGYADYKGGQDYNEELAARRVLKIANYLLKNGVKPSQITSQDEVGKAYARQTEIPDIQAQDRKVEIRIYGLEKK